MNIYCYNINNNTFMCTGIRIHTWTQTYMCNHMDLNMSPLVPALLECKQVQLQNRGKKRESQKVKLKLKRKVFRLWKPPAAKCRRSRWVSASLNSSSHPFCWLRISPSPCPATAGLFFPPTPPFLCLPAATTGSQCAARLPPQTQDSAVANALPLTHRRVDATHDAGTG